jgi:hypothetical protein
MILERRSSRSQSECVFEVEEFETKGSLMASSSVTKSVASDFLRLFQHCGFVF